MILTFFINLCGAFCALSFFAFPLTDEASLEDGIITRNLGPVQRSKRWSWDHDGALTTGIRVRLWELQVEHPTVTFLGVNSNSWLRPVWWRDVPICISIIVTKYLVGGSLKVIFYRWLGKQISKQANMKQKIQVTTDGMKLIPNTICL